MRIRLGATELQGVHHREIRSIKIRARPAPAARHGQYYSKSKEDLQTVLASRNLSAVKIFVLSSAAMTIGSIICIVEYYLQRERYSPVLLWEGDSRRSCKINAPAVRGKFHGVCARAHTGARFSGAEYSDEYLDDLSFSFHIIGGSHRR